MQILFYLEADGAAKEKPAIYPPPALTDDRKITTMLGFPPYWRTDSFGE
jgi:hypothetical protein